MISYISFLRAINVGGANPISMAALKQVYEDLGCLDVQTILQTGNVLFRSPSPPNIAPEIESRFGHRPEVILKERTYFDSLVGAAPFRHHPHLNPSWKVVMFLASKPSQEAVDTIKTNAEEIWLQGEDLCITYPGGIGRSKVTTARIEKALGILGTMRNWRTLQTIHASG